MKRPLIPAIMLSGSLTVLWPSVAHSLDTPLRGATTRVSVGPNGGQANGDSGGFAVSTNGRYVAFNSGATNLVAGDTNGRSDVFVRDRAANATTRISLSSAEAQGNGDSEGGGMSADGRYVVFASSASNLVPGDTNGVQDLFLRDRVVRVTTRVSVSSAGGQANAASEAVRVTPDGRYIVFTSKATNLVTGDTNGKQDVFIRDRSAGTTTRVSVGLGGNQSNGDSVDPAISANGGVVVFSSFADNLVSRDVNGAQDIFARDLRAGTNELVSVATSGAQVGLGGGASSVSADGRLVVFGSDAPDLVAGDTNDKSDVFMRDRAADTTTRVSVGTGGIQGNDGSGPGVISPSGRYVSFDSRAGNLVPGDTNGEGDVFLRDLATGTTSRVSINSAGKGGESSSYLAAMSPDARYIAFNSPTPDLVPGDTNRWDAFLRDRSAIVPATTFGDFNKDGWSDVIARHAPTGALFLYPGGAAGLTQARIKIGTGWSSMSAITRLGDFTKDGHEDLIARQSTNGALWLYPGTGSGFSRRVQLGRSGWNGMREITAIGDLTGDHYPDLLAVQTATGQLYLYPGHGTSLDTRRRIGTGWNSMSELTGVGDFNRDGHVDLIARHNHSGSLFFYPGKPGALGGSVRVGSGWNSMRELTGVGDLDRDGYTDLIAVQHASGKLYWYPGRGTGFRAPLQIGIGWTTAFRPVL